MIFTKVALFFMGICIAPRQLDAFEFPSNFELCRRNDEACMIRRANEIVQEHPNGYPEIFLQSFEPFHLKKLDISASQNSPFNFNLQLADLVISGYSNMTFKKIKGFEKEPVKIKIETESTNPRVTMQGRYRISGRLLVFPITGEGECKVTIYGLNIKTRTKPTYSEKEGKTYLKSSSYKLQINAEGMKIHLTNLFNGEKFLSENMLRIINDNWKLFWDEMAPIFNKEIAAENMKILDAMFGQIPYEDLFLSD